MHSDDSLVHCTQSKAKPEKYCLVLLDVVFGWYCELLGIAWSCFWFGVVLVLGIVYCLVLLGIVLGIVFGLVVYCLVLLGIVFGLVFSLVSWYCELFSIVFGLVFVQSSHQLQPFCGSLERMVNIYITGENLMADLTSVWKLY